MPARLSRSIRCRAVVAVSTIATNSSDGIRALQALRAVSALPAIDPRSPIRTCLVLSRWAVSAGRWLQLAQLDPGAPHHPATWHDVIQCRCVPSASAVAAGPAMTTVAANERRDHIGSPTANRSNHLDRSTKPTTGSKAAAASVPAANRIDRTLDPWRIDRERGPISTDLPIRVGVPSPGAAHGRCQHNLAARTKCDIRSVPSFARRRWNLQHPIQNNVSLRDNHQVIGDPADLGSAEFKPLNMQLSREVPYLLFKPAISRRSRQLVIIPVAPRFAGAQSNHRERRRRDREPEPVLHAIPLT